MGIFAKAPRVAEFFKSFRAEAAGSVAIMVGFSFPVMFIAAGGAFDYTNAVTETKKAQRALDSVVLQLTRRDLSTIDVQQDGEALFQNILAEQRINAAANNIQFSATGTEISGSADMQNKTYFLGYVGMNTMPGKVESRAIPPIQKPIEIALVLDVSGSMSEDLNGAERIERLKTAVNGMFDTLDSTLPPTAKYSASVVPYSSSVNLGDYHNVLAAVSVGGQPKPATGTDVWAAERTTGGTLPNYNITDASPTGTPVPFVTDVEMSAAQPTVRLTPLTVNIATVRTAVDAMTPQGWTAGHIGMEWGVYTLSNKWASIWPEAPEKNGDAEKIIVMLSDGQFNTTHNIGDARTDLDPASTDADGKQTAFKNQNQAESDAYFQNVCDLAKTRGIIVYTVALNLDATSEAKLAACAGNGGGLYTANSANDLSKAFEDIARRLGQRRLTS